jgi:hypothetical protein
MEPLARQLEVKPFEDGRPSIISPWVYVDGAHQRTPSPVIDMVV